MRLKDEAAIKLLKRANCSELTESINSYRDDEIGNKTDIEIVVDELNYIIELYEDDGTLLSDDLREAREILREARRFKSGYDQYTIERSKRTVNEYRRLKRLQATYNR